jgi:hypothetical protein
MAGSDAWGRRRRLSKSEIVHVEIAEPERLVYRHVSPTFQMTTEGEQIWERQLI